jgi:hypothetical protein
MPRLCGGGFVDLTFQRRQNIYGNGPNTFQERKCIFFPKKLEVDFKCMYLLVLFFSFFTA